MIDEIIDKSLEQELRERKIGHYYVSEIPYCQRNTWYKYMIPRKPEPATLRIFERGNILHDWIAETLRKSSKIKLLFNERSLIIPINGILLRGRLDNLILLKNQNKKYVVEVKATANINFTKKVSKHHLMQITPYMMIEECLGIVIYIDSRYLTTKEFIVELDWKIWNEIKERATTLHAFLLDKKLPPKEALLTSGRGWECNFCLYRKECKAEKGQ